MESLFTRYRNLVVLLALLLIQLVGLAIQVRRTTSGTSTLGDTDPKGVRLIRLWANAVISPPERLVHWSATGMSTTWSNYIDLVHVREQNKDLKQTVGRLRLEQAALLEDARQGQRLQAMLGFQQKYIYSTLAAQVYGSSGSDRSHVFYIDKGWHEGLRPDMAVITAEGIVGKVRDVFSHTAQVLAINDTTSGAGVILETTRIRGILRGDVLGQLEVVGVTADQRIQPGDHVLTAGGDLIFPRGLPVGVVKKVVRDPDRDGLVDIILTPAAPLDRLDEVLVITSTEPRFSPQQQDDLSKSAEEQAAVPAAIKDQVKASEIMAEKLPGLLDPNLPPDQQPLNDSTNPTVAPPPPKPLHPDEFSASNNDNSGAPPDAGSANHSSSTPASPATPSTKQKPQTTPPRNP
ncbi:MAG TPA: rod shape-determining protein MreC [Terracidiphilus sp.]|jgi:rod shape-determining protein MreC